MDSTACTENIDNMGELSSMQSSETVVVPNDREKIKQIFEHIYAEIQEVFKELKKWDTTPSRPSCTTVNEKTVVLRPEESLLENRIHIIRELTKGIKHSTDYECPRYKGDGVLTLPLKLQEETEECKKLIEGLETTTNKDQNYIEWLTRTKRYLQEMNETLEHSDPVLQELSAISTMVDKEYKECKRDLNTVIEALYPDTGLKEVLGELVEKSLKEQWYEVENMEVLSVIHNLCNSGIVVRNSQNQNQFKLVVN